MVQNWDETPLWEDELEGEEVAVTQGSNNVSVNVSHAASRNKFTTVLTMMSLPKLPIPPPAVIFKVPTSGVQVRKRLEKELQASPVAKKTKFFVTPSGNTTGDLMPELHKLQEDYPPPMVRLLSTKESGVTIV